ncbi:H/ACA ribonucleoprotein complex non-core subunit NAF1 [Scleropages formosus]|uniref:H/ACA ribonucleoprotein complex non-core subunit NAF1 n=1 Tax=Scleropages formosus TaxID=113540 RepID=A0A8C9RT55_SCLFO|nr:H/ACA ribonucleoprotein complex non-core subunit NAF1 [Scleropages formosus]XP_018591120.2 H/ACA ribonucleoprotein complex non-core subunit NAF1 [Scleropages formosus]XP_018591121.2 H/ACA ribonucleoprotein complex non-core subunit NAF1 [Scleropages formosus]XP_018591122.2 H/ACA ribonucleoprotein complex non-core subunit NAF1 [Scleropages formosus]
MGDQAESNMDRANDAVGESIPTLAEEPHADPSSGVNDEAHNKPDRQSTISDVNKDEPEIFSKMQASIITETSKEENMDVHELCERGPEVAPGCKASGEDMEVSVSTKMETLVFSEGSATTQGNLDFSSSNNPMFPEAQMPLKDEKEQFVSEDSDDSSSSEDSSSDSDSDSSSSSSSSSSGPTAAVGEEDDDVVDGNNAAPVKTQGEILIEELPAVEDVVVYLPEHAEMQPIGIVSQIIDKLVIIQSLKDMPPLNEDSVVFNKDRQSVGKVFEIFGPVPQPYYVLRFNSVEHMAGKGLALYEKVYFAPLLKDFTDYVFTDQLKMSKGSDASWKNDQEPPPEALDFSDDEQEKAARQKKNKKQVKRQRWPDQGEDDNNSSQSVHSRQPAESRRGGGGYRGPGFSHQPAEGFHNRCFPHSNATMMTWAPHRRLHPLNNRMMVENRPLTVPPPYPVPFQHQPPYMPRFPPPPLPGHMTMPWPSPPMGPPPTLHAMTFGHVPPPPPPPPPTPSTQPQ